MSKETELSDEQIHTALDSVDPEFWDVPMDGTLQFARAIIAADRELRRGDAQMPEPVASVYTMDALVPGGGVRHHVTLHKPLPAGTKLYTAAQVQAMLAQGLAPGWKAVPVKPTDAMVSAMLDWGTKQSEWEAILAAAPQPPVAQPSPAAVERKPLTVEQIDCVTIEQWGEMRGHPLLAHRAYARAIEAAHGITTKQGGQHGTE